MAEETTKEKVDQEVPVTTPAQASNEVSAGKQANEQPEADEAKAAPTRRRKAKRTVAQGAIHVLASFNNTIITVTDEKGNTLTTASAGSSGFRGSKKGTAYAAQVAAEKAISSAKQNYGLSKADVMVKGVGLGRDAAVRTLMTQRIGIESIKDITTIPHGGVRPRKPKRN
ncbi:MAG TPA: 30S ribosomal protein S11 [Candidatus Saccharimonadales bacterium]|nr:30S ribosomal protein S11 [Candidatus Saccharimonadales bacterium]